jgi:hypothetical protein
MFANRMSAVMNRRPTLEFYPSWAMEGRMMYTEAKMLAYSTWHELLTSHETAMKPEERYNALLELADEYFNRRIIDLSERNTLIEVATTAFTRSF